MIVIDMDMPTKCMNCQLLGRDAMYCQVYPRKDLNLIKVANGKPDWCPIKCDIDDIKTEIKAEIQDHEGEEDEFSMGIRCGLRKTNGFIDKHIGGENK